MRRSAEMSPRIQEFSFAGADFPWNYLGATLSYAASSV